MLEPRERRTIAIASTVLAVAVVFTYGVLPFVRHWSAREALIATRAEQVARLRWLATHQTELQQVAASRAAQASSVARPRLLSGRSPALAASLLQTIVQGYADEAGITVSQLNVSGAADSSAAGVTSVPATLSAVGDIYGVADFVSRVQHGTTLIEIREIGVSPNPALRGELLQLSLSLRAPYGPRGAE